eukprot:128934_1
MFGSTQFADYDGYMNYGYDYCIYKMYVCGNVLDFDMMQFYFAEKFSLSPTIYPTQEPSQSPSMSTESPTWHPHQNQPMLHLCHHQYMCLLQNCQQKTQQ